MKVALGTTNRAKIDALGMVLSEYGPIEIFPFKVDSGVSDQPKSLEETILGAKNRAVAALLATGEVVVKYSFGIESGLMQVTIPGERTTYFDFTACVMYDGKHVSVGLSSAFELPKRIQELVFDHGHDLTTASNHLGLTSDPCLGDKGGIVDILTNGRLDRKEYTLQAIHFAFAKFNHPAYSL